MLHKLTRNGLQVEIAAFGAVGIPKQSEGGAACVKSPLTGVASPGLQTNEPGYLIQSSITARAIAVPAAAVRTNHFLRFPRLLARQHTEKFSGGQGELMAGGRATRCRILRIERN